MVHAACVQMAPVTADKEENVRKMEYWIRRIRSEHVNVDLILFPELAVNGYDAEKKEFENMAERPDCGPASDAIRHLARECGTYIAYGYAEAGDGVVYNSMLMVGRGGEIVANYRKVHLFASEKKWGTPGDSYCMAETDFGKVGMMVCYDTSFPEAAGTLALAGADMLAISTNWEDPHLYDWDLVTAARAFDNTLYVMGANRVGRDRVNTFSGHSRILDPMGRPLAALDTAEEGYIFCDLDLSKTERLRSGYYQQFRDRRPDTYRL